MTELAPATTTFLTFTLPPSTIHRWDPIFNMGSTAFAQSLEVALTAVQQERDFAGTDFSDEFAGRLAHDLGTRNRRNFLCLCERDDVYHIVRSLINDPEYWEKEEQHFERMCTLVLDYNELENQRHMKLNEATCPSITTLRSLWYMNQKSLSKHSHICPAGQ